MTAPKLFGVYPYSDQRPTFGLPVFRFGKEWLIQRPKFHDESSFQFEKIDPEDLGKTLISTSDNPNSKERLIAFVGAGDRVEIGSRTQLQKRLSLLAKGGSGSGIALQAAEILGLDDDRRLALTNVARALRNRSGAKSASSFAKSAALSVAWDHIQNADLDIKDKKSVLAQLHMISININGNIPELDISAIDEDVRIFIDTASIIELIKREVTDPILESADNDKGAEYDISAELPKIRSALDQRLGPDMRMTASSYYRLIKAAGVLGIHGVEEIIDIIRDYDDTRISDIATGARQGQTSRVELMMMAALGDEYIRRYPYYGNEWLKNHHISMLELLTRAGIPVGTRKARHPANRKFGTVRKSRSAAPAPSLFDLPEP